MSKMFIEGGEEYIVELTNLVHIRKQLIALLSSQYTSRPHSHIEIRNNKTKISDIALLSFKQLFNDSSTLMHFFKLCFELYFNHMSSNVFLDFDHRL